MTVHTPNFTTAIRHILKWEKGYASHPNDLGKETLFGISRKFNPDWAGWGAVNEIKDRAKDGKQLRMILNNSRELRDMAVEFYHKHYWLKVYDELPPPVAQYLFGITVHFGPRDKIKKAGHIFLQQAVNKIGSSLRADGVLGPKSLLAIRSHNPELVVSELRAVYTTNLCRTIISTEMALMKNPRSKRKSQLPFLYGWMRRAAD